MIFRQRSIIFARQSSKGEGAVMIEPDKIGAVFGGGFGAGIFLSHMLDQELPARLEKGQHLVRQRINGFVRHQTIRVLAPAVRTGQAENQNANRKRERALSRSTHQETESP